jgi:hypothetical protein
MSKTFPDSDYCGHVSPRDSANLLDTERYRNINDRTLADPLTLIQAKAVVAKIPEHTFNN